LKILDRMPIPIASFISLHVYGGRLLSQHPITSPDCLAFIDCPRTGEENAGFSTRVSFRVLFLNAHAESDIFDTKRTQVKSTPSLTS